MTKIQIHSLAYTPDKTAVVAEVTKNSDDGPVEHSFVYRENAKCRGDVYNAVEAAILEGSISIAAPPPLLPIEEPVLTQDDYELAIQDLLEKTARSRRYNQGANAFATYVNSSDPYWAAEALAFVKWRDAVWRYAYTQLDAVSAGEIAPPALDVFIASLPTPDWPEAN